jgi:nucleoside-diphosphate-sugar epimerase
VRIAITGGAGFIGGNLVQACLAAGNDVVCLDDLSHGTKRSCEGARLFVQDVADVDATREALRGCEVVYHLAALRAVPLSLKNPLETERVNATGTLAVLLAARDLGIPRVVVASSSSVYGGTGPVPTPESTPPDPKSPYAVSKLNAENYCRLFAELYRMETVILRPFNVYGPGQRFDASYAAVIPLFIRAALTGQSPVIFGDGTQSRDFTFVSDCVQAFLLAGSAEASYVAGKTFNAAAGGSTTLLSLLELISAQIGPVPAPQFLPPRPGDVTVSRADLTRAKEALGYAPTVDMQTGLGRTIAWLRDTPGEHK